MKAAIFGSTGMVGFDLSRKMLRKGYELVLPTRELLDQHLFPLDEKDAYDAYTYYADVDWFINCTGYTNVDGAEHHREKCFHTNRDIPYMISVLARKFDKPIIHLSSDYVYYSEPRLWNGGEGFRPQRLLNENFLIEKRPSHLSVYAESKIAGERAVEKYDKHYIIRTSWLFGGHRRTWMDIVKDEFPRVPNIYGLSYGTPTLVSDLSEGIIKLIEKEPDFGIYNFTNTVAAPMTKLEALELAARCLKEQGGMVRPFEYFECHIEAPRPFNSGLSNTKFSKYIWNKIPTVESAIKRWLNM